jgi:hypothetical protein
MITRETEHSLNRDVADSHLNQLSYLLSIAVPDSSNLEANLEI